MWVATRVAATLSVNGAFGKVSGVNLLSICVMTVFLLLSELFSEHLLCLCRPKQQFTY